MANDPKGQEPAGGVKSYDAPQRSASGFLGTTWGRILGIALIVLVIVLLGNWIF